MSATGRDRMGSEAVASSRGEVGGRGLDRWWVHLTLVIGVIVIVYPLSWAVMAALRTTPDLQSYPPTFLPREWTPSKFVAAWEFAPLGRFIVNSIVQAGTITLGQIVTASLAAYAFARLQFRGRDLLFLIVLATMMIPIQVIMIPLFALVSGFGWANTYAGLTVPFLAHAFSIFLLRQFFLTVPRELEEAAMIDGASRLRFLITILLPIARPALGAVTIFTFVYHWNTYLWPLIITSATEMRTVQPGLAMYIEREAGTDFGRLMAASIIIALPTLVPFLVAQRQFIKGVTLSGVKG